MDRSIVPALLVGPVRVMIASAGAGQGAHITPPVNAAASVALRRHSLSIMFVPSRAHSTRYIFMDIAKPARMIDVPLIAGNEFGGIA
jgi:hypothetical protein